MRSLFWLLPRTLVITVALYGLTWVEWSPFPEWSYIPVAYVLHFLITYIFARWTYGRHIPSWIDAAIISAVFILLGTGIEIGVLVWKTGASIKSVGASYNWHSLAIVATYILAVFAAAWRVKHKQKSEIKQVLPSATRSSEVMPPSSDQLPPAQA